MKKDLDNLDSRHVIIPWILGSLYLKVFDTSPYHLLHTILVSFSLLFVPILSSISTFMYSL